MRFEVNHNSCNSVMYMRTRLKVVCASEGSRKAKKYLSDAQLDIKRKIP